MEDLLLNIENNNQTQGLDKIDQLRRLNEESNPIIIYYEYKDAE